MTMLTTLEPKSATIGAGVLRCSGSRLLGCVLAGLLALSGSTVTHAGVETAHALVCPHCLAVVAVPADFIGWTNAAGGAAEDSKARRRSRARSTTAAGTPASRATWTPQLLSAAPGAT